MGLGVFVEVVAPHEPLAAGLTGEALLAGVSPEMPLQLVRPRERLATEQPAAHEGALPGVPAQVRLEVRGLTVNLSTVREVADVQAFLLRVVRWVEAVGAAAAPAAPGRH